VEDFTMIHLPFADRSEAGRLLAAELSRRTDIGNATVLALARGGVPVGFEVANRMGLPLDAIVVRKIGVPWQPELAMGAMAGTALILNKPMLAELEISDEEVQKVVRREQAEMTRREELYREGRSAPDLHGQTAILVDDGLATGSTMLAAVRHARSLKSAKVVVGVPVGSRDACDHLRKEADDVVCLAIPEFFYAVGEWYRNFQQVSDDEVRNLLRASNRRLAKDVTAVAD
jgi:putative phosphoribosyl transferase